MPQLTIAAHFFVVFLNGLLAVPQSGQDKRGAPLFFSAQDGALDTRVRGKENVCDESESTADRHGQIVYMA